MRHWLHQMGRPELHKKRPNDLLRARLHREILRQHPHLSEEEAWGRAGARALCLSHPKGKPDFHLWYRLAIVALLLLALFFALRVHGQVDCVQVQTAGTKAGQWCGGIAKINFTGATVSCTGGVCSITAGNQTTVNVPYKGAYSGGTTYAASDVVSESGASYVSLQGSNVGHATSDASWWGLLAAKGDTGATGDTGPKGDTGDTGPAGPTDWNLITNKPTLGSIASHNTTEYVAVGTATWPSSGIVLTDASTLAAAKVSGNIAGNAASITGSITKSQVSDFPTLGNSSGLNVGTSAGTVAAGDDSRFAGVPSGMIMFIKTGTCPTGWTEETALSGYYMLATKAANNDVGGSAAASLSLTAAAQTVNSLTAAAQTVNSLTAAAQTFTGDATTVPALAAGTLTIPNHTHTTASSTASPKLATSNTSSGVSFVTGNQSASAVTGSTSTGTLTPLGHNASSAVTGTMNSSAVTGTMNSSSVTGTVTPAYYKLIPCSKN